MTLTNLKTVKITVTVASVKLTAPADRIGLGFGTGKAQAYPTDPLSPGRFLTSHNPEPEQFRSRQGRSAMQMRKQMLTGKPGAVPPASLAGYLPPGSSADRFCWSLTAWSYRTTATTVSATELSRNRVPQVRECVVRNRLDRDCQSLDRFNDKRTLAREATPIAAVGK